MREEKTDFGRIWKKDGSRMRMALYVYDDEPSVAYLSNVFVDEDARGMGIGNAMLAEAEAKAVAEGCSEMRLWCKPGSFAWRWYARHGYSYMCDKEDEPGMIWMYKSLGLNEMAYPKAFDMEEFKSIRTFTGRVEYCRSKLRYLGRGSSRMVFEIDDEKVLKLAYNTKGVAQNEAEADPSLQRYGIFAEVFDYHPSYYWIEMEKAVPAKIKDFDRIYGGTAGRFSDFFKAWKYDLDEDFTKGGVFKDWLCPYVFHLFLEMNGKGKGDAWYGIYSAFEDSDEYEGSLFEGLRNYMYDWDLRAYGDLRRISSYGVVKRNGEEEIVLIDYGLTNDVYDNYYGKSRKQR